MLAVKMGLYNLMDGGIDPVIGADPNGSDTRFREQMAMLAEREFDVLGLLEGKHWTDNRRQLQRRAEAALGMTATLVESSHHGCHLVLLTRPGRVTVLEDRHEQGHPYWHAVACQRVEIDGNVVDVALAHLAPASPQLRLAEAESLALLAKTEHPLILMGDFNAVPSDYEERTGDKPRKLDRRPALALEEVGLRDVALVHGDRTPTVGHARQGAMAYPCDRFYTNLPRKAFVGYRVATEFDHLSDHRLVVTEVELGEAA
ncbi:endonuclease/exonuclease/phosphatase family protein [Streptosporangium sp. NBC_01495]|uniref:endonuclease/exonuclease/phosphatase family protein n=1 Tax=Streptosporangium sp. NBC_01495 TaxID=2903899 RepID=UPI002E352D9C|nr:endonuclease/exonuclease/phosphatase family protein [Streptosporangium sp. NBC_01495]